MFQDLDKTLDNLLEAGTAPAEVTAAVKSFRTPDSSFSRAIGAPTVLNLFLYRIQENLELRQTVGFPDPDETLTGRRRPLLRVECTYLVTAWSTQTDDVGVREEHRLLGKALQWLSSFPTIPKAFLSGDLVHPDALQVPLPYSMSATLNQTRLPVDFWTALGIPPRPSFDLNVTIAILRDELPSPEFAVTDRILKIGGKDRDTEGKDKASPLFLEVHQIGGTVQRIGSGPVDKADVRLSGTDFFRTVKTIEDGSFRFAGLTAAEYQLSASDGASSTPIESIKVPREVTGDPDFDLTLP